ncbi:MAG: hypothetical protein KKB65_06175 [Nanoarchaeota archaeon]|nr:hypothetical protein [Nanoarchaeota archaeon]MBU1030793.1 hypothetical protein [Nanoarchaeota archaeon]
MGINNAAKPDHIILAGTNPKRPVHGYSCKALLPYKQKPLVYYVSKASAESKMFNKQIIIGPKKDLENVLFEEFDKMKHFSYKIIQENEPGDAEQIVHNAIKALDYLESDSKYTFISGCDILGVTGADIKTICFDGVVQKGINMYTD